MSVLREQYKLLYPLTEVEYEGLLDSVIFTDEIAALYGVKVDIFATTGSDVAYVRENLDGATIISVMMGQVIMGASDYSLSGETFTLAEAVTAGTSIRILYI